MLAAKTPPTVSPCARPTAVGVIERKIRGAFGGLRPPGPRHRHVLSVLIKCAADPARIPQLRSLWRHAARAQRIRIHWAGAPEAAASWYYDQGDTASGEHFTYGFASLAYGSDWGLPITFCMAGPKGCIGPRVTGRLDDHGPYVYSRRFDLNQNLKDAVGCDGVCTIRYRVGRQ